MINSYITDLRVERRSQMDGYNSKSLHRNNYSQVSYICLFQYSISTYLKMTILVAYIKFRNILKY